MFTLLIIPFMMFLLLMPDNKFIYNCCLFYALLLTFKYLLEFVKNHESISTYGTLAISILLGYVLGTAIPTYSLWFFDGIEVTDILLCEQRYVSFALIYVLLITFLLLFCSKNSRKLLNEKIKFPVGRAEVVSMVIATLIIALAYIKGDIGFMGQKNSSSTGGGVPILGAIVASIAPPVTAVTAYCIYQAKDRAKVILIVCFIIQMLAVLVMGRRILIISAVISGIGFSLSGYNYMNFSRKNLVALGVGAIFLILGMQFFFAMRQAGRFYRYDRPDYSLSRHIEIAAQEVFMTKNENSQFEKELAINLKTRSYIISYFSRLIEKVHVTSPLYGEVLRTSVLASIPRALYRDKGELVTEESLAMPHFSIEGSYDEACTILTSGASDFSLVGMFAYPVLLGLFYALVCKLSINYASGYFKLFTVLFSINNLLQIETSIINHLAQLRVLLILLFVFMPIYMIFKARSKKSLNAYSISKLR